MGEKFYADDYEAITGHKPGEEPDEAPDTVDTEDAGGKHADPETKVVTPDSPDVQTA